jgi:hypothetical protein
MLQSLILTNALSSACGRRKKNKEMVGSFFSRAGAWTCLLAVLCWIFVAFRCN